MNIVLLDDEDEMLSAIRTQQADYAWYGGLGLDADGTWRDVMRGVVATSAARPTIGALGGRRAASFSNQYLAASFASTLVQPCAFVVVANGRTASRYWFDGIGATSGNRISAYVAANLTAVLACGVALSSSDTVPVSPYVYTFIANGALSQIWRNGTLIAEGNAWANNTMTGITIGAYYLPANYFSGSIASLIVVSGTNYAARAAAIANAARRWYRTG